ncbi:MAG: 50S ribosomal protein L37ae [archaeon]|nr:MAG: 50S ribosomal protein L37ae [archaeon]
MARTKKTKSTGRFGPRYGVRVKGRLKAIESKQRKTQKCPFCKKKTVKRLAKGIWSCNSCKRKFTGDAYFLNI